MYESSLKVINRTTIWVRHSTFGICLKEMKLESCRISAPPSSLPIIVQFSSAQWLSRLTLCNLMNHSTPGLPVHHQRPEFSQTHVHWVGDVIQPYNLLLSPSPPTLNLSQHQGLFKSVSSSHEVAKVLEFQLQHQSFQWIFRTDLLQDGLAGSPCSPRDSQETSPTPQFKSINFSTLSSHIHTWPQEKP